MSKRRFDKLGGDLKLRVFQYMKKAERKLGEILAAAKAAGQITKNHDHLRHPSHDVPNENMMKFKDGKSVKLVLEIDRMDLLTWLGGKALQSKGGKSQIASGAIRVRVEY